MITEIELKLNANLETLKALLNDDLINQYKINSWQTKNLINSYFDTQDFALQKAGFALRIRIDGSEIIQTLKTKGKMENGLAIREEFDFIISKNKLDFSLIEKYLPKEINKIEIKELFTTNFTRDFINVTFHNSKIELACDDGLIKTISGKTMEICEIELELKQGETQAVIDFANILQDKYNLTILEKSKAQRALEIL